MRRSLVVFTVVCAVSVVIPSATAVQFKPKMSEPESFKDILFGLKETRDNVEGVECGGWNEPSDGSVDFDPPTLFCNPVFTCKPGINTCSGYTGTCGIMRADGSIPICLSNSDAAGGMWDYLILHELTHAKQSCEAGPGVSISNTQAECCAIESEAYAAQCGAEEADGLFAAPINGIQLTVDNCISYGINKVSCAGYGPNACNNDTFPPGFGDAYLAAITTSPRNTCENLTTISPSPRVKALIDEIKATPIDGGATISGFVPLPDISPDVPGRKNIDPRAYPDAGVGERGNFEFPDTAFGYNSACIMYDTKIKDKDLEKLALDIKYDDVEVDQDPNVRVEAGNGTIDINPYGWCIRMNKATPRWCEKLFKTWLQEAAIAPRPAPNPDCPEPTKQYCFDPAHTKTCTGQECRTLNGPNFGNKLSECHREPRVAPDGTPYEEVVIDVYGYQYADLSTFYRHYGNPFSDWTETRNASQTPLTVTTPDKTWKLRVDCYEYYQEQDPRDIVMGPDREQCEIVNLTAAEQTPDKPEWKDGANEKQKDTFKAPDGIVLEAPRDPRAVDDPWEPDTETNLSILDIEKLSELQANQPDPTDITGVMSAILETKQRGSKTVPDHARTDNFNDDDHRAFGNFWEKQQTELQKMVQDSTTKLVMPARFLVGLADDDPLFQYVRGIVSHSDGTVEMTLRAGPEDIGNVLESFARISIGPIQQVRIPIAVPSASENELDLLIFQWEQWKQYEDKDAVAHLRPSNGGMADDLIAKLEDYKEDARKVRRLRNALVEYLLKLFEPQKEIREYVADWYEQNSLLLRQAAARAVQKRELKELWRETQKIMLETDESQLNWCSNQRYSAPVYSLLDQWWGDRARAEPRNHGYTPPGDLESIGYAPPKDQQYDFSDMRFSREPLLMPVLWPIQVSLKLPQPPLVGVKPPPASDFPDLPDLPDETIFNSFTVPDVDLPPPELIVVPVPQDLTQAIQKLGDFKRIVENMKNTYQRFQPSILTPPDAEQKKGNPVKIIHVENDLKERIARMFSRWLPERKVDYAGRTARLFEEFGPNDPECKEDVICMFLPAERQTKISWQWFVPESDDDFTSFAEDVKDDTLPTDEADSPYDAPTLPVLRRFFPNVELPAIINLEKLLPVVP